MPSEYRQFTVTIPASTLSTAPVTTSIAFPPRDVVSVRWRVPPGPLGLMGWRLSMSGNAVIPNVEGTWIVADDEYAELAMSGYPDSGGWSVTGYNTDIYDHTVYLTFGLDQPAAAAAAATPAIIPAAALAPASGSGTAGAPPGATS